MLSKPVQNWLSEYKGLSDEQIHTFACTVRENKALIEGLYTLLEAKPCVEELDPVCHQLFQFYRSQEENLRRFALELIPSLIGLYLRCLSYNDKKMCRGLEVFLLGVYNLEIAHSDGSPKIKTFRISSVNQGSIYHEPVQLSALALTESTLNRYNRPVEEWWRGGPHPQYESINGQNRQAVLSQLLQVYNTDIAQLASHSHNALCLTASKVCVTGLPSLQVSPTHLQSWPSANGPRPKPASAQHCPRMTVTPALLVEMLWGINFAMYNGCDKVARDAVRDAHARACFELLSDVQLVTEAILNSDSASLGETSDGGGPMGIPMPSVSSSPHVAMSKSTLTNASFKTKKLPDDIPMAPGAEPQEVVAHSSKLSPIEEESKGLLAKQVPRQSKGRSKKEEKQHRAKDWDTSSNRSLVLNGDSVDSVTISVVKNQAKVMVDSLELELRPLSKRYSEDHPPISKGNSSTTARRKSTERGDGGERPRSRPNSFHGALLNPESI